MKMPFFCLFFILILGINQSAHAQKIAYVDADAVIAAMPDYKRIQSELETYQKQMLKQLDEEKKAIAKYYVEVIEKVKLGSLSPKQQQDAQDELENRQNLLKQNTIETDKKLVARERALSKPMYSKFEAALKTVAKANGYDYILDKKLCVFSAGGIDATDKLKKELGA